MLTIHAANNDARAGRHWGALKKDAAPCVHADAIFAVGIDDDNCVEPRDSLALSDHFDLNHGVEATPIAVFSQTPSSPGCGMCRQAYNREIGALILGHEVETAAPQTAYRSTTPLLGIVPHCASRARVWRASRAVFSRHGLTVLIDYRRSCNAEMRMVEEDSEYDDLSSEQEPQVCTKTNDASLEVQ
jgi:hypothetical protein